MITFLLIWLISAAWTAWMIFGWAFEELGCVPLWVLALAVGAWVLGPIGAFAVSLIFAMESCFPRSILRVFRTPIIGKCRTKEGQDDRKTKSNS
jgi:hypothetical protein